MASFEPQKIGSLKHMHEILKAGDRTKKAPESAFDTAPYLQSKKIK